MINVHTKFGRLVVNHFILFLKCLKVNLNLLKYRLQFLWICCKIKQSLIRRRVSKKVTNGYTMIFGPGKKHLFLVISSTDTDTLVLSLYQCVETRITGVFWLLSQPLPHLVGHHCDFRTSLREFLDPVVNRFTQQTLSAVNRKYSLWISFAFSSFAQKKKHTTELCSSVVYSSRTVAISNTETSFWTCACMSAT
jgi:hypothetical protein